MLLNVFATVLSSLNEFFFKRKADFWQTHLWVTVLGKNVKKRRFPTLCVSDHHDLAAAPCTVHGSSKVDSWRGGGPHPASNQDPAEWEKSSRHMRCWSRRCCCAAAVLLRSSQLWHTDRLDGEPDQDAHGPPWKLLLWLLATPSWCSHHSTDSHWGTTRPVDGKLTDPVGWVSWDGVTILKKCQRLTCYFGITS